MRVVPKCRSLPSSCPIVLPKEVDISGIPLAVQDSTKVLEEAPASVSPPAAAVSLMLDTTVSGSQIGILPIGEASETVIGSFDPGRFFLVSSPDPSPELGVPASVGEGQSRGFLLGELLRGSTGVGIQIKEGGQFPFFDEVECSGGAIAPNTAVDRIATIGSLSCSAKGVGPFEDGIAPCFHDAPAITKAAANLMEPCSPVRAVAAAEEVSPDEVLLVGEKWAIDSDSDGVSSQSSEGCSQLLNACCVVEEVHNLDRMENVVLSLSDGRCWWYWKLAGLLATVLWPWGFADVDVWMWASVIVFVSPVHGCPARDVVYSLAVCCGSSLLFNCLDVDHLGGTDWAAVFGMLIPCMELDDGCVTGSRSDGCVLPVVTPRILVSLCFGAPTEDCNEESRCCHQLRLVMDAIEFWISALGPSLVVFINLFDHKCFLRAVIILP
ncbi:hypothetical protein Nepgr_008074 [Nepenthes gracilis]|uniref:Uncharacterized protein n=1 Tax=Nepenthes gracilis TaxID=150966 RepID=A0AAD3S8F0_NEPGR|nr:hypothetical protein Nepgr_008074 [Nepenthes gracilis]